MNQLHFQPIINSVCSYCRPPRRGPVKRLFSTGLLALLGFGLLASVTTERNTSHLHLSVDRETVTVGENFYIDVVVDAHTAINAVDVVLQYPEKKLDVEALREGESVLTIWTEPPSIEDSQILISGGTFRRGFVGEHRILSIAARPTDTGVIRIEPTDITFLAGDGTGDDVSVATVSHEPLRLYAVSPDAAASVEDADRDVSIADLSGDGRVTMQDISIFMAAWGSGSPIYDLTGNGRMTFRDFSVLLAYFFFQR